MDREERADDDSPGAPIARTPGPSGAGDGAGRHAPHAGAPQPEDLAADPILEGCPTIRYRNGHRPLLGRIALLARIGGGDIGVVYYGVNPRLGKEVAVKVLPGLAGADEEGRARFLREARLASKLESDHLVGVLDVDRDTDSGILFLVMEYVRGASAGSWLRGLVDAGERGAPEICALDVCIAATKGLAVAHRAGVVHRGVKPDDILIPADASGRLQFAHAKLADLGLARFEEDRQGLTRNHITLGTPGYIPPEQARDTRNVGKPADVFAMGATLYALLAGRPPFVGVTPMAALVKTIQAPHDPIGQIRQGISAATTSLLDRCLAKEPGRRPQDAAALLDALERCKAALLGAGVGAVGSAPRTGTAPRTPSGDVRPATGPLPRVAEDAVPPVGAGQVAAAPGVAMPLPPRPAPGRAARLRGRSGPSPLRWVAVTVLLAAVGSAARLFFAAGETKPAPALAERSRGAQPAARDEPGLHVDSVPPGAAVVIDTVPRGITPLIVDDLATGQHVVEVTSPWHRPFSQKAEARKGARTDLRALLVRSVGRIAIEGGAPGANAGLVRDGAPPKLYEFVLDDAGRLAPLDCEAGIYAATVARAGFDAFSDRIEVPDSQTATLKAAMKEHDGLLTVASEPTGAEVFVDGKSVGRTPLDRLRIRPGARVLKLSLPEHDFPDRTVTAAGDVLVDLGVVHLAPWPVLDLTKIGDGVAASVAGVARSGRLAIPPGPVTVVLARSGFVGQRKDYVAGLSEVIVVEPSPWAPLEPQVDIGRLLTDLAAWDAATSAQRRTAADSVARREPDFALVKLEGFSAGGQTHEVAIFVHARSGLEFVLVPGGTFRMGSPSHEKDRDADEVLHPVTLTRPFLIARTECTQAAYEKVAGAKPPKPTGPLFPVENVTWDDATKFCAKAGLSLPTEARWEFACRAGTTGRFGFGDAAVVAPDVAWLDVNAGGRAREVAQTKPNAFGLFDMHGNVSEWCADGYDAYPGAPPDDPAGNDGAAKRVLRGGSWHSAARDARSARRSANAPNVRDRFTGLRPAKVVAPE